MRPELATHLQSQSLMPLSKCLKRKIQVRTPQKAVTVHVQPKSHVRLCEDVEHGDALGRLRRLQVVQRRHGVDDPEHDGCFHPVVHQVGVSQAGCKGARGGSVLELGLTQNHASNPPRHQSESWETSFMSLGMVRMYR